MEARHQRQPGPDEREPEAYLHERDGLTVEEFERIVDECDTLLELTRRTRIPRGRANRLLRACGRYDEVNRGFGVLRDN